MTKEQFKNSISNLINYYLDHMVNNNITLREVYRTDKNIYDLCIRNL